MRLSRVWWEAVPVARILAKAPYTSTGSSVSTRSLTTSFNVSEKAPNNLSDSTHPIRSIRSTKKMTPYSSRDDGVTYVNVPTWDGCRVPRWYASVTSSFETRTGTSAVSAYQITWRMRGKAHPNYIDSRATSLYVVLLNLGVP